MRTVKEYSTSKLNARTCMDLSVQPCSFSEALGTVITLMAHHGTSDLLWNALGNAYTVGWELAQRGVSDCRRLSGRFEWLGHMHSDRFECSEIKDKIWGLDKQRTLTNSRRYFIRKLSYDNLKT